MPLAVWFYVLMHAQFVTHVGFNLAFTGVSVVWLFWLWIISLCLFAVTRNAFRVVLLGFYLPLHFVSTFVASFAIFFIAFEAVRFLLILLFG